MKREERRCSNPRCGKLLRRPPWRFRRVARPVCDAVCRALVSRGRQRAARGEMLRNGRPYVRARGHLHADGRGYVLRAILVAEGALGRPLALDERVAYVDWNPRNLDPRNLTVGRLGQPTIILRDRRG